MGKSITMVIGIGCAMIVGVAMLYHLRHVLPIVQLKVGVSFLQILAASNSAYDIPWPPAFASLLNMMKIMMVDIMTFIPASCTQPMNYYASLVVVLVVFKLVLAALFVVPSVSNHSTLLAQSHLEPGICMLYTSTVMCQSDTLTSPS